MVQKNNTARIMIGIVVAFLLLTSCIESATALDTIYIKGSVFNGSDITNDDMGYIGTSGDGILEINASNFAGFYYDLNRNVGTEKFEILQNLTVSGSIINKSGLVYTTSAVDVDYKSGNLVGTYNTLGLFGDQYIPITNNELSTVLMDDSESHTIREGQAYELAEGYAIIPQLIDVNGDKVWMELTKNGVVIDDAVIYVTNSGVEYNYSLTVSGVEDILTLKVYVKQVFQGQVDSLMIIDGIWQISDKVVELDTNTTFGLMKVQEIGQNIKMINNESITLSRGSTVDITNNMSIVVADSTTDIRFHFSKKHTTPGTYEVRGEAYNISSGISGIIDYSNFAGFYYNLDTNLGTESLEISSISDRTINANSLIYTTIPKAEEFEYASWGSYNVTGFMGEKYLTGYPAGIFGTTSAVSLISNGQLSEILIDDDKSRSIYSGAGLILEDGYVLNIVEVDKNGDKVFVNLTKGGTVLDSSIISSGSNYIYKKDLGSSTDVPIITVHFDNIVQGTETDVVFVDGIFQISDQYKTVSNGNLYGLMEVVNVDSAKIEMKNANSITLTKDTTITIMDKFKFKVADDSNNARFYPFTEIVIESPVESPMSSVYNNSITEGDGYQINNYVIDVTDVFISANTTMFKVYDTGTLKHDVLLNINDSYSFDFEGSTVQLTLQSIIDGVLPRVSVLIETNYSVSNLHTNQIVNGGHEYATYAGNFYTMQLQKGWNLVSTPLTPDTPNVNTLFDSNSDVILPIYSWNTANKQYYDVSTIEISKGYWILALNDTQVTFAGTPYGG